MSFFYFLFVPSFLELNADFSYFFIFLLFCFFLQFSFHAIWELFRHILNCVEPEALNMAIFASYRESKVSLVFLDVNFTLPHTYFHVKWQNMAMFLFRSCWTVIVLGFS
jgi:hypothetical protein